MPFNVAYPAVLLLLPLSLIPLLWHGHARVAYSSLALIPPDKLSTTLSLTLRILGIATIALLILAISRPYRPAYTVERVGQGAQMVLLLDRSRSMDQAFVAHNSIKSWSAEMNLPSKGFVARKLLSEFAASRKNDMFGMVVFSTFPMQVLPLTQKQEIIQAAIAAGNVGRGLAETDVGAGLEEAIGFYADRPYTGSRIVLLVSDGAAELNLPAQERIAYLLKQYRVALYWIYIRSKNTPDILEDDPDGGDILPARKLHLFFSETGSPYRAYKAENSEDLQRAIEDVGRLQNLPIHYADVVPRRDLSSLFFVPLLPLFGILIAAKTLEIKAWR